MLRCGFVCQIRILPVYFYLLFWSHEEDVVNARWSPGEAADTSVSVEALESMFQRPVCGTVRPAHLIEGCVARTVPQMDTANMTWVVAAAVGRLALAGNWSMGVVRIAIVRTVPAGLEPDVFAIEGFQVHTADRAVDPEIGGVGVIPFAYGVILIDVEYMPLKISVSLLRPSGVESPHQMGDVLPQWRFAHRRQLQLESCFWRLQPQLLRSSLLPKTRRRVGGSRAIHRCDAGSKC